MGANRQSAKSTPAKTPPELVRFVPASLSDARVAAMRLRASLPDLSPSHARDLIAQMLGAPSWASLRADVLELDQTASLPDSEVDAATRRHRRDAQAQVLVPVLQTLVGETDTDPTDAAYVKRLAMALVDEVHASDPQVSEPSEPIDWLQRPPVARTDLLGAVAVNWWLKWRRTQLAGIEALTQTHDDVEAAERVLEIDVLAGSPSSLIRLARAWGELVQRPGVGLAVPDEATAFVLDRIAVEYACERARRADAWRAFTERRSRVSEAERNQIETEFDRELWSLACELLATQPCAALTQKALENPGEFRDLAQRGRSRFEPGLRALAKAAPA